LNINIGCLLKFLLVELKGERISNKEQGMKDLEGRYIAGKNDLKTS